MTGLLGLLFGLAAGLWASKYLLLPVVVIGVGVWAMCGYLRSCDEISELDAEIDVERAAMAARADEQHQQVMCGDRRGTYGVAMPAVGQLERILR